VSGTVSNQGRFYPSFDAVVLLSAPARVILDRIERRTTNDYGKSAGERELVVAQLTEIEPRLRATCTHEIDATQPVEEVVAELVRIGTVPGRERDEGNTRLRPGGGELASS
jgi:thymidylate kinase